MRHPLHLLGLLLTLTLGSCYAQRAYVGSNTFATKQLNLAGFTGILVSDGTEATVRYGTEFSVTVRVNDNLLDRVRSEIKDGVLFVAFESGSYRREELSIDVTMPAVSYLRAVDGAAIEAGDFPDQEKLQLEAYDSGRIAFSGSSEELQIRAADAGKIRAYALTTASCEARVSDNAEVEIRVENRLSGRVSDGGNIYYRGRPTVEVGTSDGGRVVATE